MLHSNDNTQSTLTDKMGEAHQHYMAQKETRTKGDTHKRKQIWFHLYKVQKTSKIHQHHGFPYGGIVIGKDHK